MFDDGKWSSWPMSYVMGTQIHFYSVQFCVYIKQTGTDRSYEHTYTYIGTYNLCASWASERLRLCDCACL